MTTRYIRLPIIVSVADPSKCSEECPRRYAVTTTGRGGAHPGLACKYFGALRMGRRAADCIAAEESLSVAMDEARCLARGFSRTRSIPE